MKWFKLPGEDITKNRVDVEWEGSGWYCTTRTFPGSELYRTWRIDGALTDGTDMTRQDHRDDVARSFGGPVQYLSEQPAE